MPQRDCFLRFCALKLADGSLGKLELAQLGDDAADDTDGAFNTPPGSPDHRGSSRSPKKPRERERGATDFTDAELDLSYWFPLLAGLSELTPSTRDGTYDEARSRSCSTYSVPQRPLLAGVLGQGLREHPDARV